jgi:hypothetical protein
LRSRGQFQGYFEPPPSPWMYSRKSHSRSILSSGAWEKVWPGRRQGHLCVDQSCGWRFVSLGQRVQSRPSETHQLLALRRAEEDLLAPAATLGGRSITGGTEVGERSSESNTHPSQSLSERSRRRRGGSEEVRSADLVGDERPPHRTIGSVRDVVETPNFACAQPTARPCLLHQTWTPSYPSAGCPRAAA